jgi:hypothetical protein
LTKSLSAETKFHLACRVGRLVEVRPEAFDSVETVASLGSAIAKLLREAPGDFVFCVDWRKLRVLAPDVAEALVGMMKSGNSRVLRSAALIGGHATFNLQVERLIRATDNPSRRAFRDAAELLAWIGEVSTAEEAARARQFLLPDEAATVLPAAARLDS